MGRSFIENRECSNCGSTSSYKHNGYEKWFKNPDNSVEYLCSKCFKRLYSNPRRSKELRKKYNDRRMKFKDRSISLPENPRIGVCNFCRAVVLFDCKRTDMHHFWYNENNPLDGALESCSSCHRVWHHEFNDNKAYLPELLR